MKRAYYIIISTALLLSALSCGKIESGSNESGNNAQGYLTFDLGTKLGGSGTTTYRTLLLRENTSDTVKFSYAATGTYREAQSGDAHSWLTPCLVNASTGEWDSDNHFGGLRANRGTYRITFVSPAKAPVRYTDAGGRNTWGYSLTRDDSENFYVSKPVKVNLTGNHLNGAEVFNVADSTILKERRAKIKVELCIGADLYSAQISKVGWTNIISDAYYNIERDSLDKFTVDNDTAYLFTPAQPAEISHTSGKESVVVIDNYYVFALDYGKKTSDDKLAYSAIPELCVVIGSRIVTIKVKETILPQYEYLYKVTVNTAFISVDVYAAPWSESTNSTAVSDEDTFITGFTWTYPTDWQNGGVIGGSISTDQDW